MSVEWVRRAKRRLLTAGLTLLVTSALLGVGGILGAFFVVEVGAYAVLTALAAGVTTLFGMAHGIFTLFARSYFRTGWLEANGAAGSRFSSVILTGAVLAFSGLAAFTLHLDSNSANGGEVFGYMIFFFLPCVLSFVATIVTVTALRSDFLGVW